MRLAYWSYEGTAHHGVARIANSLRGVHAVVHAPQGDGYVTPIFAMLERSPHHPQVTTSVVQGRDLTLGVTRLPDTLRQVEATHHPDLIVICASCSTTLLQEDLQVIADQAGLHTPTLVFDINPFRYQEAAAADKLLTALVERMAQPTPRTPTPSVNLIGPASLGFHARPDLIALRRMLQTLGIAVNAVVPWGARLDDLRRLPAAWVTIAPYRELGHPAADFLGQRFGIPALTAAPIGVQPTLRWLAALVEAINAVGAPLGAAPLTLPPLPAFSLDGLSAPSAVPWFARTADMDSFHTKRAFVFGDATRTVGMVKFLHDELGMQIAGAGTYLGQQGAWIEEQLAGYLPTPLLVTQRFQDVAAVMADLLPDLVCGTQMERHSARKLDLPCMVIAPPTHIENHLLSYRPILGFDGADYLADTVMTSTKLGMEKHLIDLFGDAGLDYAPPTAEPVAAPSVRAEPVPTLAAAAVPAPVNGAAAAPVTPETIAWTPAAEKLLQQIPFFVRGRVRKRVAKYAVEHGYPQVTDAAMQAAREFFGG